MPITIIKEIRNVIDKSGYKRHFAQVKCMCGKIFTTRFSDAKSGRVQSCGCIQKQKAKTGIIERSTIHGLSKHPLHNVWRKILCRCYNPKDTAFHLYGGRGILVYRSWKNYFILFYDWCMLNGWKKGLEIDRRNNNKGYYPWNCRFVTRKINCRNRRSNIVIRFLDESKTLIEWCTLLSMPYAAVRARISVLAWDPIAALLTPVKKYK